MTHERVEQPEWSREYIAPSYNVGERVDVHGLEVFAEILGGGATSKLYRTLKWSISSSRRKPAPGYEPDAISYGTFSVSLSPNPGVAVDKLETAYDALFGVIVMRDGITDADVARAKNRMIARLAYAKDSPIRAASEVGAALAAGLTLDDIENWPAVISAVTADQVRAAAHKLIATASTGTGILLPQPQIEAPRGTNGPGAAP